MREREGGEERKRGRERERERERGGGVCEMIDSERGGRSIEREREKLLCLDSSCLLQWEREIRRVD